MTSVLTNIKEESGDRVSYKSVTWSLFKLVLGIAAVLSFYTLENHLNQMGCRFAVVTGVGMALPLIGLTGKQLLNHRFTGYILDLGYLVAVTVILFNSLSGIQTLENKGCTGYWSEHGDDVAVSTAEFMNKSEYKDFMAEENSMGKTRDESLNFTGSQWKPKE